VYLKLIAGGRPYVSDMWNRLRELCKKTAVDLNLNIPPIVRGNFTDITTCNSYRVRDSIIYDYMCYSITYTILFIYTLGRPPSIT
jgi:hypothetical protein